MERLRTALLAHLSEKSVEKILCRFPTPATLNDVNPVILDFLPKRDQKILLSLLSFSRIMREELAKDRLYASNADNLARVIFPHIKSNDREHLIVVYTARNLSVLHVEDLFCGGIGGTSFDAKVILRQAVNISKCSGISIGHNHPSGRIQPSESDCKMATLLKRSCLALGLKFWDSLILDPDKMLYYSMAEEGLLEIGEEG